MQVVSLSPRQGVNVYQIVEAVEVGQLTTSAYLKTLAKIVPSLRSSVASAGDRHAACSMSAASCMVPSTSAPVDQRRCRVQLAKGGKGVGVKPAFWPLLLDVTCVIAGPRGAGAVESVWECEVYEGEADMAVGPGTRRPVKIVGGGM